MITTTIDVSAIADISKKFVTLQQADTLLRLIAVPMQGITRERIHEKGLKADGTAIGDYSKSYLKLRQSDKYKRSADPKVILSLTRDMEREYRVIPLSDTEYALGWENPLEAQKADWNEQRFGKVWALTQEELDGVRAIVQDFIKRNFE